jgi:hypothetical protein
MGKNVATPTLFVGPPEVPFLAYAVFETVEDDHVMTQGNFCSKLQNLRVGPRLGEGTRLAKVAEADTLHSGKQMRVRPERG